MAEALDHNLSIKNTMGNYSVLRGCFKNTPRGDKSKVYIALQTLQMLLELTENVNKTFMEKFKKILEKFIPQPNTDSTRHLAFHVYEVIKKGCYKVVTEHDSNFSVSFPFGDNQPSLPDNEIYSLLEECEQMFVHIHNDLKGADQHLSSCAICKDENFLQSIIDKEKQILQSIQESVEFSRASETNVDASISATPGKETKKLTEPVSGTRVASKTSEKDNKQSEGKAPGTSDKKGHERQCGKHTEKTAGIKKSDDFTKYEEQIHELKKEHEDFFHEKTVQMKLWKRFLESAKNGRILKWILTYNDTQLKKMEFGMFEDQQEALSWACSNIPSTGESLRFIKFWKIRISSGPSRLDTDDLMTNEIQQVNPAPSQANAGMKKKGKDLSDSSSSSRLHTDDLMINEIQLVNPSPSHANTVIAKVNGMWDTGADFASFPFDPIITETLINGITKINGKWCPVVYAKLIVNGEMLPKIYKVEMDPDETWCAIGNPQMADLERDGKEEIFRRMEQVVYYRRKQK